ncbi:Protein CBG00308 [Caenorhabditis briggsae]|uniref:Protein CBG00308 n=1 Tax=Caenorhabditis briggsae TaxID=6238 RepID=A8WMN8_CAEBR|nr:Protein CBG00308 [Caenorhabditis briggsae]CAP21743.2 Protein CBG00308 [Caenorhabditis briggsae]
MSSQLPPAFKPIAHYIKIANENASRDPIIYYWSLLWMVLGSSTAKFDESSWRRLQKAIIVENEATELRDSLRDSIDAPDETMSNLLNSEEISRKILEKQVNCETIREKIEKLAAKICSGRRKIAEIDEKMERKVEDEAKLERKILNLERVEKENLKEKNKKKRVISIMIRLNSYRKLWMIEEVFAIFKLKIDGGPASTPPAPRHCSCQVIDTIRGIHLPQLTHLFQHPEPLTFAALQHAIHLFDVISRILNYAPKHSTESLRASVQKTWKKRLDREKFAESLIHLGRNVTQLREACGIPTMATDRTLGTLDEWIRIVIQKEKTTFERPVESLFYAVQTAMKLDKSSLEARQYLTGLLTTLESIKTQLADNEAIKNETIAQAHIESFAEKLFNFADKKEKTGKVDKSVVHAFYTAGHVMDILALFGEIDEPFLSSKKYAKWKSTQIFTCLRDGTPYVPSIQQEQDDDELAQFGAQFQPGGGAGPQEHSYSNPGEAAPRTGFGAAGIPHVPSDNSLPPQPPARSNVPPPNPPYSSTPNLPSQQFYPPAPPAAAPQNPRHQQYDDFSTPSSAPVLPTSGAQPTDEEFAEIRKLTKYAMSAVDYEDVKAIRENLQKALAILQKY